MGEILEMKQSFKLGDECQKKKNYGREKIFRVNIERK